MFPACPTLIYIIDCPNLFQTTDYKIQFYSLWILPMKMNSFSAFALTTILIPLSSFSTYASDNSAFKLLTGDKKYACEAITCLTSPTTPPIECRPSLHRFYSIQFKYGHDTISARRRYNNAKIHPLRVVYFSHNL